MMLMMMTMMSKQQQKIDIIENTIKCNNNNDKITQMQFLFGFVYWWACYLIGILNIYTAFLKGSNFFLFQIQI